MVYEGLAAGVGMVLRCAQGRLEVLLLASMRLQTLIGDS
jgi:hypothetical protein